LLYFSLATKQAFYAQHPRAGQCAPSMPSTFIRITIMNSISNSLHNTWTPPKAIDGRQAKAQWVNEQTLEDVNRKDSPSFENNEATFSEAMNDVNQCSGLDDDKNGRRLIEVSLRDPWPPDDPLRQECDQFLKLFEGLYHEVLGEMGMTPKSGDYSAVVMSKKDLDEISRRMVEKLKADPEARELMTVLNIDFSDDIKTREANNEKPSDKQAAGNNHGTRLNEADKIILEELRKRRQEAQPDNETSEVVDGGNTAEGKETASKASKPAYGHDWTQYLSIWLKSEFANKARFDQPGLMSKISKTA
jgi:hypothetical protein